MRNFKLKIFFFLALLKVFILAGCGVAEHTSPQVLSKGATSFTYGLTILQTGADSQIGDEFVPAPFLKSSWGIGNKMELSLKTFGLGLGAELKKEILKKKDYAFSFSFEGDYSFPMMSYLVKKIVPVDQDFRSFVSKSFYFIGGKIHGGLLFETVILSANLKSGYLDNSGIFPDMGGKKTDTDFPGFVLQGSIGVFFKENRKTPLALGIEVGYIWMPIGLLYFSGSYSF